MGWGCWSSLRAGSLPAGWLEKLGQVGKGPMVLPGCQGPQEWGAQLNGWSLSSWCAVWSHSLWFRVPVRSQTRYQILNHDIIHSSSVHSLSPEKVHIPWICCRWSLIKFISTNWDISATVIQSLVSCKNTGSYSAIPQIGTCAF